MSGGDARLSYLRARVWGQLIGLARTGLQRFADSRCRARARYCHYLWGIDGVAGFLSTVRDPVPVLRAFGAVIGEGTYVYPGLILHGSEDGGGDFSHLVIGRGCRIGRQCIIDLTAPVTIEDRASLGMRNVIITHVNVAESPIRDEALGPRTAPVSIGSGAVTYTGVTILLGVSIGECAVVGAGSVVSSSLPAFSLSAGNPLRMIRRLALAPDEAPASSETGGTA